MPGDFITSDGPRPTNSFTVPDDTDPKSKSVMSRATAVPLLILLSAYSRESRMYAHHPGHDDARFEEIEQGISHRSKSYLIPTIFLSQA
ncbi:hypothetical protein CEP52_013675 [Fusarium oligoseptatum]|uniref:Uncharacterized protein n=1 Tax=Fusarium oligoseptatum TaxID=2604345 RepID=A0A428SSD8_9HYPO|nr:hypothetical protein CEP52_013675 [Fusarium oligoseptatum]